MSPEETLMARALNDEADDIVRGIVKEHVEACRSEVDQALFGLTTQMNILKENHAIAQQNSADLQAIKATMEHLREIIEAWNSAKGFVMTIKFLSMVIKWSAVVGGSIGIMWYLLKFGTLPPK